MWGWACREFRNSEGLQSVETAGALLEIVRCSVCWGKGLGAGLRVMSFARRVQG